MCHTRCKVIATDLHRTWTCYSLVETLYQVFGVRCLVNSSILVLSLLVSLVALQEGASALDAAEAARLVGPGAADRDGRGNVNVGDGGVAFVLAAAAGTPGGPDTVRRSSARLA